MQNNPSYQSLLEYCQKEITAYPSFIEFKESAEQIVTNTIEKDKEIHLSKGEVHPSLFEKLQRKMRLHIVDIVIPQLEEFQNEEWFRAIDAITMKLLVEFQDKTDENLWDRLVNINYPPLEQYCKKVLHQEFKNFQGDAQEMVDFAFLKAHKKACDKPKQFDTIRYTSIQPWLQRTARNWALGHFRKLESRFVYLEDLAQEQLGSDNSPLDPEDTKHTGPITAVDRGDRSEILNQALSKVLSTSTRRIVHDRFLEKSTIKNIAKSRGTTIHKVRYRLESAIQRLESWLLGKM